MPERVVLLHGFGGTSHAWDGVAARLDRERYRPHALDLPGHGGMGAARPITLEACVSHVLESAPGRFTLCGYSMGGRIALLVALAAPQRIARLVLISCSAGIADEAERARRRRADERLAHELEQDGLEEFIRRWRSQPLFAEEPDAVRSLARADHLRNRPADLAAAMRGLGQGVMAPLWDSLAGLGLAASVVVGSRDDAYRALGRRMVACLPRARLVVLPGGHGLPLENPAGVARVIEGRTAAEDQSAVGAGGRAHVSERLDAQPGR